MSTPNFPQQPPEAPAAGQSYAGQAAHQTQQQYPQVSPAAQYPQASFPASSTATTLDKTNTFALLSIVLAFISPIAGIVFGHMGLGQIKRNGDAGRGIALTGLIISYAYFVFVAIFIVLYVGFFAVMIGSLGALSSSYGAY